MASVVEFAVNGSPQQVPAEPDRPLLSVLRDELGLTGSKYGCGEGQCGACTVLLDGLAIHSCVTPVSSAAGKQVTTIEGLEHQGKLHPVQQAFADHDAMQCGYCTPGMIMAAVALLNRVPNPTDQQLIEAMNGNVCRCGTYPRIVAAIRQAAGGSTALAMPKAEVASHVK